MLWNSVSNYKSPRLSYDLLTYAFAFTVYPGRILWSFPDFYPQSVGLGSKLAALELLKRLAELYSTVKSNYLNLKVGLALYYSKLLLD